MPPGRGAMASREEAPGALRVGDVFGLWAVRPGLLGCLGLVIGTCSAEGKGLAAIGSAVTFICTLCGAAVWLLIQKRIFRAAWHLLEWNICLYKWLLCCQHLTRCSQTCVIVGSVMMIICIFNVQTVLKKQPRLNLPGEDLNMFCSSSRSPRKSEAGAGQRQE